MSDPSLDALSTQRATLPVFPGATLRDQLLAGRDQAGSILRGYAQSYRFEADKANEMLALVNAWQARNAQDLQKAMADPLVERLPDAVELAFGSDIAQGWIVAVYVQAATGLGPWVSGAVEREAASGRVISPQWAQDDAAARLKVFASIVQMEKDGYLRSVFQSPPAGTASSGFGFPAALIWPLVVVVVAVAALFLVYLYASERLELNNKILSSICAKAQAEGDTATVRACVDAQKDLQSIPGVKDLVTMATWLGAGALAIWAVGTYLPPWLARHALAKGREARA